MTHAPTLLTRAGRRQLVRRSPQSPHVEINTQDHGKDDGRQRQLEEMPVHVIKIQAPEESRSDDRRCQDKSIESSREKNNMQR